MSNRPGVYRPNRRYQPPIEPLESRTLLASISGHIFYDLNGNGIQDPSESGAFNATQTIFLDQNDNGVVDAGEPSTTLDALGNYTFPNLVAGGYRVRLMQDQGYLRTTPETDSGLITVTASQDAIAPTFGVTQNAQLAGNIFNDANGNTIQDSNEPALPGATVFLDQNNNASPDSSSSMLASTDIPKTAHGIYTVPSNLAVANLPGLVQDVNVTVNITSPDDSAPQLYLENPQGIRVLLVTPHETANQHNKQNFTNTVFDDQAPRTIAQGVAPFPSQYQTSGFLRGFGLNQFNNISPNGTWRLILIDTSTANTAILNSWSLSISSGDPQTKTDFAGNYIFPNLWPGAYHARALKTSFNVSSPASGQINVSLNASDQSQSNNFGLHETATQNATATFAAAVNLPPLTQDNPFGIVQGDFNKDGKLDLATVDTGSNDVGIYFGNGNGTFKSPVFYPVGQSPRGIAVADLNKDGFLDIIVTNQSDGTAGILLGGTGGTFRPEQTYAAGAGAFSVAVADFNGDGKLDLAVADEMTNTVSLLMGNGDGTFNAAAPITVGNAPVSIKAADINKDGKQDLITANSADNTISVLLGTGTGTFGTPITTPVGNDPVSLNVNDLNGDGKQDLIVANAGDDDIEVLIGKNTGSFTNPTAFGNGLYATGDTPAAVNLGDFNKDGKTDIAVSDRSDGVSDISGDIRIYLGNGNGTLQPPFVYTTHSAPVFAASGDFNGDGKADLAVVNFSSNDVSILLNNTGNLKFSISGNVFTDTNGNGILDAGEAGLAGVTVYVDSNNDKIFQSTEPHAVTDSNGNYTITGLTPTNPAGNPPYDVIRQIAPTNYTQTVPAGGLGGHIAITNFNVTNANFGDKPPVVATFGSISGLMYTDTNGSGRQDPGEPGVAGRTMYIDSNLDGVLDNGELATTSDSNGNWSFTNLSAGVYRIREQNLLGIQHTQPVSTANYYDITLAAGQAYPILLRFGDRIFAPSPAPIFQISASATADFVANNGITNLADSGFTGGAASSTVYDVAGTDNDPIYYSYRSGASFSYSIAVPNGNYKLILLFADPTDTAAGQRKFNVSAQGKTILSNFDIVAAVGAKTALAKSFAVTVTSGVLNLQFTSTVDLAIVSGIQLVPA